MMERKTLIQKTPVSVVRGNYTEVDRANSAEYEDVVWLHNSNRLWVVHYEAIQGREFFRQAFYKAYVVRRFIDVPKGKRPWSQDNISISGENNFRTLQQALDAGDKYMEGG
ncbi:MAG TPA: hypothetical protein VMW50_12585 [Dehalococcoidia bacterium]|nr:hypothetical protein [Dehalococcoidia bacterium]